jgi:hypothetical protein
MVRKPKVCRECGGLGFLGAKSDGIICHICKGSGDEPEMKPSRMVQAEKDLQQAVDAGDEREAKRARNIVNQEKDNGEHL